MARRARRSPQRTRARAPSRRFALWLMVLLLAAVGVVVLERAGALPERVAVAVWQAEAWLAPLLEEVGLELPAGGGDEPPGPGTGQVDTQAAVMQALALLVEVEVEPERPRGYEREDWPHWLDQDGDCMDARDEVLAAESLESVRLASDGCNVASGLWRDAYTGETFRDPARLDVDHFVPLAEAHRSGGHAWSRERRAAFANDLGDSRSLIAVGASVNRSKSDQGPEEWLPPHGSYRCRYAADWVAVKVRWSLSMDERERVTVSNLLRVCA